MLVKVFLFPPLNIKVPMKSKLVLQSLLCPSLNIMDTKYDTISENNSQKFEMFWEDFLNFGLITYMTLLTIMQLNAL